MTLIERQARKFMIDRLDLMIKRWAWADISFAPPSGRAKITAYYKKLQCKLLALERELL